ncbi:hypothetical protein Q7P37_004632 [Cladosporium fusiforme]
MVFPSRGCRTCVQRRIKCDTKLPVCGRCEKSDRKCIWSPNDQAGLHFISENVYAQGRPRRPRASKQTPANELALARIADPSPQPSISISLDDQAFHYWAQAYVPRADELQEAAHEWNTHVVRYWTKASPGSCLHLAVSTLSRAVFGRARGIPVALIRADQSYAQCLVRTQQAVMGQAIESMDELLLTAMLMGFFENIRFNVGLSEPSENKTDAIGSRFLNVFSHYEGAMGLLRIRRERSDESDLDLDKAVRRQIIRASILRGHTVPEWLQEGEKYGESGVVLQMDSLMVRTAAFRSRALAFFPKASSALPTSTPDLEYLAHTGKELEDDLVEWAQSVPQEWQATQIALSANPEALGSEMAFQGRQNSYTSHGHASIWLRQRALRLIINSIFIKFIAVRLQSDPNNTHILWKRDRMCGNLDTVSSNLCADVPFFFDNPVLPGKEGTSATGASQASTPSQDAISPKLAGLVAWPLAVAVSTENVPEPQRQWLQKKLKAVASSLGDSVLEAVAERGEFKF